MFPSHPEKIIATIEARMASSRLPGKVLLPLAGKPALERLIERLKRSKYLDGIVVATTDKPSDDVIEALAKQLGVGCFRGSEDDVLGRVLGAAQSVQADVICEITGDCPLLDWRVVDRGVEEFFAAPLDYAANCLTPSYPLGLETQVFPTKILAEVDQLTQDPIDRTHVSYYIYAHPEQFRVKNWLANPEAHAPEMRLTLDEPDDLTLIDRVFSELLPSKPDFSAEDVVALLKRKPELLAINEHVRQKQIQEG